MDDALKNMMEYMERNSQISMDEIFQVANSLQHASLQDEEAIRTIVRQLSHLTGHTVSMDVENQIVQAILNGDAPTTTDHLQRYFSK